MNLGRTRLLRRGGFVVNWKFWWGISILVWVGCDVPSRPVLIEPREKPERYQQASDADDDLSRTAPVAPPVFELPAPPPADRWETWNAYYAGGKHCGYGHVLAERLTDRADADLRCTIDDHLSMRNGKYSVFQSLHHESIEDSRGQLKSFTATQGVGPLATRYIGTVENGQLTIRTSRGATESTAQLAWEPDFCGSVAVEQSLRRKPLSLGEVRMLKVLVPVQHRIATVRLVASNRASVPLLDGAARDLLEVTSQISMNSSDATQVLLWTDDTGTTLKSYTESFGLVAYRTDAATATNDMNTDPGLSSGITLRVTGTIDRPNQAKRTAWILRREIPKLSSGDASASESETPLAPELAPAAGQAVRSQPNGVLQVLVSSESVANLPGFTPGELPLSAADTQPSALVDFNSPLVRRLHTAASIQGQSQRDVALEMMSTLGGVLEKSPRSRGLAKASEVALNGVADSTGYAVLLAGLLRASDIPARIVVGLVYDETAQESMHYHAWTIAHVDGDWLPLDATLGRVAPSNRLALLTSDFAAADLEQQLLGVLTKINELDITIARSQY